MKQSQCSKKTEFSVLYPTLYTFLKKINEESNHSRIKIEYGTLKLQLKQ